MYTTKSFYLKFLQTNTATYKNRTGFLYPLMVISLYIYIYIYIATVDITYIYITVISLKSPKKTALGPFALRQPRNFSTTVTSSSGIKPLLVVVSTPP